MTHEPPGRPAKIGKKVLEDLSVALECWMEIPLHVLHRLFRTASATAVPRTSSFLVTAMDCSRRYATGHDLTNEMGRHTRGMDLQAANTAVQSMFLYLVPFKS